MRNSDPHAAERQRLVRMLGAHSRMMAMNTSMRTRLIGTIEACDCDMCHYAMRRLDSLKSPTRIHPRPLPPLIA